MMSTCQRRHDSVGQRGQRLAHPTRHVHAVERLDRKVHVQSFGSDVLNQELDSLRQTVALVRHPMFCQPITLTTASPPRALSW